jgi:demethylspheroidene O-methyltransferase
LSSTSHSVPAPHAEPTGRPSLRDRWRAFRNRCIADPRFQRGSALFPLTRPVALKNARALFDVTAGFVYSQILFACVKLDLFRKVGHDALTLDEIAARIGLSGESAERLVRAAATLRLTERRDDGRWAISARRCSARPASPRWSSTTPRSTTT